MYTYFSIYSFAYANPICELKLFTFNIMDDI